MPGIPTALAGQLYHSIDGVPAVTATNFQFTFSPPLSQKYGFAGYIGTAVGQSGSQIRLTFATTAERDQFQLLAKTASQNSGGLGFNYDFWEGTIGIGNHWLVTNCFLGEYSLNNDPAGGSSDRGVSIMGAPPQQIG